MNTTAGRTTGKALQRSMEARLGRAGREIDRIATRAAACRADVRAKAQRQLDHLRLRYSRAREHLRQQGQADQTAGNVHVAELAWDLNELDVELAIAEAALDAELAADAETFDVAVQTELGAWNDWIGLLQAKATRDADTRDQAEMLASLQQRSAAAAGRLHQFRASSPEAKGQARDDVEQAMAELRRAAGETAKQVSRRVGDRPSKAWPVPTASQVRATRGPRPAHGGVPRWLAGWGWPSPGWTVAFGLLTIVAGVILLAWPRQALTVLGIVLGIQLLIAGVFWVVSAFSVPETGVAALVALTGVLGILVGLLMVGRPIQGIAALVLLVGLYWTVAGLVQFVHGVRGYMPARGWTIAAGVVGAAAGIVVLIYPLPSVLVLTLLFGILLILHGTFLVAEGIRRRQRRHTPFPAHS